MDLQQERARFEELDPFNTAAEEQAQSKGWLLKARFADGHASWYWVPLGSCHVCLFYEHGPRGCTNRAIPLRAYRTRYQFENTCPGFEPGIHPSRLELGDCERDCLAAMQAAGLATGELSEPVDILERGRWSRWRSHLAHVEQGQLLALPVGAREAVSTRAPQGGPQPERGPCEGTSD